MFSKIKIKIFHVKRKNSLFFRLDNVLFIRIIKCTFPAFVYKDLQKVPQKLASTFGVLEM